MKCETCPFRGQVFKCLSGPECGVDGDDDGPATAPHPGPSLVAKAASFATAVVKHVAAGCPTRTEERQAELKSICLSCVHQQGEASRCGICGCSRMDLKRSMKQERCPMGFWPEDGP